MNFIATVSVKLTIAAVAAYKQQSSTSLVLLGMTGDSMAQDVANAIGVDINPNQKFKAKLFSSFSGPDKVISKSVQGTEAAITVRTPLTVLELVTLCNTPKLLFPVS